MYKSQSEITFTIKLNNPKGESIDAIELTCDDPNAQIMVDGEYKPIQFNENSEGVKSRIVNWAQEDPYEKVYYIKTTSMDDINTLRVIDLKVNGEWQNHPLSNDELKIYKMNEEDLKWKFVQNCFNWYKWSFENSERISNLKVMFDGEEVLANSEGVYKIERSGLVKWEYDYTYEGITVHWNDERNIELVEIVYTPEKEDLGIIYYGWSTAVYVQYIYGTDIDMTHIYWTIGLSSAIIFPKYDGRGYYIEYNISEQVDAVGLYMYFGNSKYYINTESNLLEFIE
jgi:hypothetical protein